MNDYVRGAFEALSWVQTLISSVSPQKDQQGHLDKVLKEVEAAIVDIKEGVAVDFRDRLKTR